MRPLKAEEREAIAQFRSFAVHDAVEFTCTRRMAELLKVVVYGIPKGKKKEDVEGLFNGIYLGALERRGCIRQAHGKWVPTEIGHWFLEGARFAGLVDIGGAEVTQLRKRA